MKRVKEKSGQETGDYMTTGEENSRRAPKGQVFNAGHNRPIQVLEVVETILRLSGRTDLHVEVLAQGSLHGEIDRQWLDGEKAKQLLGWEPRRTSKKHCIVYQAHQETKICQKQC